jgi:FtsH-binding integral membrane protein
MEVQDLEKIVEQQSSTHRMERDLARSAAFPALMRKVYLWMTMALVITGLCAWGTATSPSMVQLVYGNRAAIWVLLIAELGLVFYTTARIQRLSLTTATTLFIIYSALNGVTLSSIFMVYAMTSIAKVFFITAGTFGVMALYGSVTKTDLSKFGNLFLMALFGLIIATVANLFIKSSGFDLILSYIGVVLFVGLTAWDSQQIKRALSMQAGLDESAQKVALLGALELYLDFINLFLYLLRIFGRSDN